MRVIRDMGYVKRRKRAAEPPSPDPDPLDEAEKVGAAS